MPERLPRDLLRFPWNKEAGEYFRKNWQIRNAAPIGDVARGVTHHRGEGGNESITKDECTLRVIEHAFSTGVVFDGLRVAQRSTNHRDVLAVLRHLAKGDLDRLQDHECHHGSEDGNPWDPTFDGPYGDSD